MEEKAKALGICKQTAYNLKKSGVLDDKLREIGIDVSKDVSVSSKKAKINLPEWELTVRRLAVGVDKYDAEIKRLTEKKRQSLEIIEVLKDRFCKSTEKPLDGPTGETSSGSDPVGIPVSPIAKVRTIGEFVHNAIRLPDDQFADAMKLDNRDAPDVVPINHIEIIPMASLADEAATVAEMKKEETQENGAEELAKAIKKALPMYYDQQEPSQENIDELTRSLLDPLVVEDGAEETSDVLSPLGKDAEAVFEAMKKGDEIEEYELFPKKEYDFYKKTFTSETKQEFLKIKVGEYEMQHEIMPEGFVNRMQLEQFRQKKANLFDFKDFMKQPIRVQVKYVFHASKEFLRMLNYRLEEEVGEMFDGTEFDKELGEFVKNMGEWQRLVNAYYRRFVVDKFFPVNRVIVTGELLGADFESVPKEKVEEWERLRLKWLDYLPKDLKTISFYDIPVYILGSNPDAWVNPETLKVEIRKPKKKLKTLEGLPWEEIVRYISNKELKDSAEHYLSEMTNATNFEKKEEYRIKGLVARSELRARQLKYDRVD